MGGAACAGAILVIIICFMAVTSSGASEMLAVSSLFTFDVYRRYINPKVGLAGHAHSDLLYLLNRHVASLANSCCVPEQASGERLVRVSRIGVICWATFMGIIMCIAQVAQINVNWLINIIGEHARAWLEHCRTCL